MNKKIQLLKILSISALVSPLTLISCNNSIETTVSEITIDRELLLKNISSPAIDPIDSYTIDSVNNFIEDFKFDPGKYIIPAKNQSSNKSFTPFIYGNKDHFSLVGNDEPKIEFSASNSLPTVSTMTSIKFSFKLKSEYKPKVMIDGRETINNIFSVQVRTKIPEKGTVEYKEEVLWIKSFLFNVANGETSKPSNIEFLNSKIKKETYSKTPAVISKEIVDRESFEKIFKLIVPFPDVSSKWNYEVHATISESSQTSINLNFKISNPLFPDLTVQEINGSFTIEGFSSK